MVGLSAASHQPRSTPPPLTHAQKAYYGAFLISMVACWSPWKALAYFAPVLAVIWFLWWGHCPPARRRAVLWILGWIAVILAYWKITRGFDLAPAVLTIVTYGTIAAVYVIPSDRIASPRLLGRLLSLVALVTLIEALFGIAQAFASALQGGSFDIAAGDAVQGTIFPSLSSSRTFANPMFAVNMGFMLIGLMAAAALRKKWRPIILLGLIAFVLASVMHAIFLLAVAALAGYILCRPRIRIAKSKKFLVFTLCAFPVITYLLLSQNVLSLGPVLRQAFTGQSPRAIALVESVTSVPRQFPLMPIIGLGPGQFSSNAALLASGTYYGGGGETVPLVRPQSSSAFSDFLTDLIAAARNPAYGGSITVEPFFSWLSVYTEFGLPSLIGVFVAAALMILRVRKRARSNESRILGAAAIAGIVFFVLLGFQADYWEIPQAVLIGALLTKAMYATLTATGQRQNESASHKGLVAVPNSP